ncbi:MAG TPA: MoaD/ThiS family protein [Caulobacter sp.]|nr:MoaD/ThiS family protein [Caulobacter sp.]
MARVFIPSQLQSYSGGLSLVEAPGATVEAVLRALDSRFPGIRFRVIDEQDRVRPHMRLFVGSERTLDIRDPLGESDELLIFGALSGG